MKSNNEIALTTLVVALAFLAVGLSTTAPSYAKQPPPQVLTDQDKRLAASQANVDLNKGLPTMMDRETMVTKVEATIDSRIYYLRMVNYRAADLNEDFLIRAQEIIGRRNCSDKDIRWAFDQDIYYKYIVSGSDNRQVGSFIHSKIYCQKFR